MAEYFEKPAKVEAMLFDGTFESGKAILEWLSTLGEYRMGASFSLDIMGRGRLTLEYLGGPSAFKGEYIVVRNKNEATVMPKSEFESKYAPLVNEIVGGE